MARSLKENKRKLGEFGKKVGRKPNRVRIAEMGVKLAEYGQYPIIKVALGLWSYHMTLKEKHSD